MKKNLLIDESGKSLLKEENEEQPKLVLLEGGKEPPTENWLKELEEGTVFLAIMNTNQQTIDAVEWHVVLHADEYTKLHSNLNSPITTWVNSLAFSRQMKLAKVLGKNGK